MKKTLLASALCATMVYAEVAVLLPVEKRTFDQSKYIPNISGILDFSYVNRSVDNEELAGLGSPGFSDSIVSESAYNTQQGFNLNYLELVMSSSIDPFFSLDAVLHFSPEEVGVEEVYFTSTALGRGFRVRGGKILSNFGYINSQHHHYWDFGDRPLVQEAFFGAEGLNELGVQLQWTAPTPFYLMAGVEVSQGDNEQMFGNATIGSGDNVISKGVSAPSLYVGYLKTSFDMGDTTLFGGLSYAQGSTRIDNSDADESPSAFSGNSKVYGADLVLLHSINSYSSIKWQSEWLSREVDGDEYTNINKTPAVHTYTTDSLNKNQSGLYTQLVYAHNQNWKLGLRYETIYQNDIQRNNADINEVNDFNKYSATIEYHSSEFSRIRLQFNQNDSLYNEAGNKQSINTIMLQANMAIGAHSAHSF